VKLYAFLFTVIALFCYLFRVQKRENPFFSRQK
jgi:hypothetical protein